MPSNSRLCVNFFFCYFRLQYYVKEIATERFSRKKGQEFFKIEVNFNALFLDLQSINYSDLIKNCILYFFFQETEVASAH